MRYTYDHIFKRTYGTLMGVACGDAMGMPTSLLSPESIKEIFKQKIDDFLPAPEGHVIHNGMKAGEITDDTQQTMLLVEAYLEEYKFTKEKVAEKLVGWAKNLNAFESMILGPSSLRALKLIDTGVPLDETGKIGDTNGAAMKIAPAGIVNPGNYNKVVSDVAEICTPTHNTNIAISGASAVACSVAAGMEGADIESVIDAFYFGSLRGSKFGNPWYGASINHRTKWALDIIKQEKAEEDVLMDLYNYIGAGVAITESVPTALALFVYYKGDPVKVIKGATNMGGDCDTVGAIAGSIAGAFAGIDAFPKTMIDKIEEVNSLKLEDYSKKLTEIILEQTGSVNNMDTNPV